MRRVAFFGPRALISEDGSLCEFRHQNPGEGPRDADAEQGAVPGPRVQDLGEDARCKSVPTIRFLELLVGFWLAFGGWFPLNRKLSTFRPENGQPRFQSLGLSKPGPIFFCGEPCTGWILGA